MPKPAKPQVKNLKYVDLIVRWRKKTADSKRQKMAEKGWDQESGKKAEERQRWREEYIRDSISSWLTNDITDNLQILQDPNNLNLIVY